MDLMIPKRASRLPWPFPRPRWPQVPALRCSDAFNNPDWPLRVFRRWGWGRRRHSLLCAAPRGIAVSRIALSGLLGRKANGATRGAYGGRVALSAWTSSGVSLGVAASLAWGVARTRTGSHERPGGNTIPLA